MLKTILHIREYLGTREGHIFYLNSNFNTGMINNFNFSGVFLPYYHYLNLYKKP